MAIYEKYSTMTMKTKTTFGIVMVAGLLMGFAAIPVDNVFAEKSSNR